MRHDATLDFKTKAGYGIGDLGQCFYWGGVALFIFYFYTDVVGISPAWAGTISGIGLIWDAATDPIMGLIAERTRTRWGTYRPYLLFGGVPLALSFMLLFWVPPLDGSALIAFLVFANIAHRTLFTVVAVPYSTLTAVITSDSTERTNLTGFRMLGATVGFQSLNVLAWPVIFWITQQAGLGQQYLGDEGAAFFFLATVLGIAATFIYLVTFVSVTEEVDLTVEAPKPPPIRSVIRALLGNGPFWLVFGATLVLQFTAIMWSSSVIYFVKYGLNMHEAQDTVAQIGAATALAFLPVWWFVTNRLGKRRTWLISLMFSLAGFLWFYFAQVTTLAPFISIVVVVGIGAAAGSILFWSIMPDTIEYGEWKSGVRSESSVYGFMTFAQKAAGGLGGMVFGFLLTAIGFEANQVQTPETIAAMKTIMSVIPAVGVVLGAIAIYFYPIDKAMHQRLIDEIVARSLTTQPS